MTSLGTDIKPSVLITGGSGLVGRYLTSLLLTKGYSVAHLSRKRDQFGRIRVHRWDPEKGIADPLVFDGIDYVIHLAGSNIGAGRWTAARKKEIMNSRVGTALLLHKIIAGNKFPVRAFISASGVGYYGTETSEKIFSETDPPGRGFLADVCKKWEECADLFEKSGIRTVKIRTAMVLEKNDSALGRLMMPAKFGFLVRIGSGRQYMPWIHISDLCRIYLRAVEDGDINGAFNAAAPNHVAHNEFMQTLSSVTGKPIFPLNAPSVLISSVMGEMSSLVLEGSRISSAKMLETGFNFDFGELERALSDLIGK